MKLKSINEWSKSNTKLNEGMIPNKEFYKTWSKIVINPGEDNNQYDNKKPSEWDADAFISWVEGNCTSDIKVADGVLSNLLNVKMGTNLVNFYASGSGLNNDKEFKKYDSYESALRDTWTYLQQ